MIRNDSDNNDRILVEAMTHLGLPIDLLDEDMGRAVTMTLPHDPETGTLHIVTVVYLDPDTNYTTERSATVHVLVSMMNVKVTTIHNVETGR